MARQEIPDTTVLIKVSRDPRTWPEFERWLSTGRVWLSSIVAAEVFAGAILPDDVKFAELMYRAAEKNGRLLVPTAEEHKRAGHIIRRYLQRFGRLGPKDHLSDVLILVSAARLKGTVVTSNQKHFEKWAKIDAESGLDVTVAAPLFEEATEVTKRRKRKAPLQPMRRRTRRRH